MSPLLQVIRKPPSARAVTASSLLTIELLTKNSFPTGVGVRLMRDLQAEGGPPRVCSLAASTGLYASQDRPPPPFGGGSAAGWQPFAGLGRGNSTGRQAANVVV